jgi:ubiquinone/menaquinone biosynthesis C-methylase UbiE
MDEMIQAYFDKLYSPYQTDIRQCLFSESNEIYGELYYYSVKKLLKYLKITSKDHFLDIGSGLARLIFQVFLTTNAASVLGIEINAARHSIADRVKEKIEEQLPEFFVGKRVLELVMGDFLNHFFHDISVIYVCSTVFSFELLKAIGRKINEMETVRSVASMRKLPDLTRFELVKKIYLQGTWDRTVCYLYVRII